MLSISLYEAYLSAMVGTVESRDNTDIIIIKCVGHLYPYNIGLKTPNGQNWVGSRNILRQSNLCFDIKMGRGLVPLKIS